MNTASLATTSQRANMIKLVDDVLSETVRQQAGGLDIRSLAPMLPRFSDGTYLAHARRLVRLLEHQRILENRDGLWRAAPAGVVWAIVAEETWKAHARNETGQVNVHYHTIMEHPRADRYSSKELMQGVNNGQGKEILHYLPRERAIHLGVYDPTMEG